MISLYELDLLLPDFSYFSLNCLSYTILSCPWMCLSTCSSMLTLDIYILQQTVLTVPQQPVRPLDSSKSLAAYAACPWTRTGTAACAAFGRACPTAAYAAFGRVCPTAAFAASGLTRTCSKADLAACLCLYSSLRPLDSSVLQQHMLPLDVCLFFERLCCLWTHLFHNSLCRLGTCVSSMWRPVLLLNVSLLCAFPGRVYVSVLQQSVMSSEVSCLQLHACASNARICSTAANAVPRGL